MITKRFLPIVILGMLLISCNNEPQNPAEQKTPLPDSVMVYNIAADKTETLSKIVYYTYDEVGNTIFEITYSLSKEYGKQPSSKREMKYDANGNLLERREAAYFLQTESWFYNVCLRWTYDTDSRISIIAVYNDYGEMIEEHPLQKAEYSWSDDTHAEYLTYTALGIDTWDLLFKTEVTYNTHSDIEKETCYFHQNNDSWSLMMTNEYNYDQYNNLLLHKILDDKSAVTLQEQYRYDYDETGKKLVMWYSTSYTDAAPGEPIQKYVYCY